MQGSLQAGLLVRPFNSLLCCSEGSSGLESGLLLCPSGLNASTCCNGMPDAQARLVMLQFVTELKAALKHTMAEPLAAELGMTLADLQRADLRLALTWLHPGSMSEADFLIPDGQKHSRGYKRKRGQGKVAREVPGGQH